MDPKERVYRTLQTDAADIAAHIAQLKDVAVGGERKAAADRILASISRLALNVADAADYMPAYDQRTHAATVKMLTEQLNNELARLAPTKPRFQFKKKAVVEPAADPALATTDNRLLRGVPDTVQAPAVAPAVSAADAAAVVQAVDDYNAALRAPPTVHPASVVRRPSFASLSKVSLAGHTGRALVLPVGAASATGTASGALTDLHRCVVDTSAPTAAAPFQSLMIQHVDHSLVVVGHVDGPVHVTGLRRCVLVVHARQVRIHECVDVDVYLAVRSRPIIEDCRGLRFAPLASEPLNENDNLNLWDQVDDFKWLRAEPSPNWRVLPEPDRLSPSVWIDAVADMVATDAESTDATLQRVGVL